MHILRNSSTIITPECRQCCNVSGCIGASTNRLIKQEFFDRVRLVQTSFAFSIWIRLGCRESLFKEDLEKNIGWT